MSTTAKPNPANPFAFPMIAHQGAEFGMTLRDYFAAAAMAAQISNPVAGGFNLSSDMELVHRLTKRSYAIADAMLKERAK